MAARATAWAVVVAGGRGARFGSYKQFAALGGRQVVDWSLVTAAGACDGVVLVVPPELVDRYRGRADGVVAGGPTRPASVRAGLSCVPLEADVVVVHDAARPLASAALWDTVIAAVTAGADAAVPCIPVSDTIKQRHDDGRLVTLDRARLVAAQTPQAFLAASLRSAHSAGAEATDDAALVEAMGGRVVVVPGEGTNLKLTSSFDLAVAHAILAEREGSLSRATSPIPGQGPEGGP